MRTTAAADFGKYVDCSFQDGRKRSLESSQYSYSGYFSSKSRFHFKTLNPVKTITPATPRKKTEEIVCKTLLRRSVAASAAAAMPATLIFRAKD